MAEVARAPDVVQVVELALIVTGPDGRRAAALAKLLNDQPGVAATVDAEPGDPCDAVIIAVAGELAPTPTELGIAESIERATHAAIVACLVDETGASDSGGDRAGAGTGDSGTSDAASGKRAGAAHWPATIRSIDVPPTADGAAALVAAVHNLATIDPGDDPQTAALDFRNEAARTERSRRVRTGEKQRREITRALFSRLEHELTALTTDDPSAIPTKPAIRGAARRLNRAAHRRGVSLHLTVPAQATEISTSAPRRAEVAIAAIAGAAAGAGIGRGLLAIVAMWLGSASWLVPWLATAGMAISGVGCAALAAAVQIRAGNRQQAQKATHQLTDTLKRTWTSDIAAACDAVEADAVGWRYRQLTKGVTHG
ncbi:hypothetical protein [Corynebacterium ulceribovis]|uniref:hypothetical protein n=1 Tax=Corynebacterium ulceribovis TaxID=487732 RepID=UPI00035D89C1|nr:hypothetical protein [Corynebacterium ulceribovis]